MSIEVIAELWRELNRYINTVDQEEAADSVVSLLIDNNYSVDEIRHAFKGNSDIKRALAAYINDELEEEPDEDEDYDDNDWEN